MRQLHGIDHNPNLSRHSVINLQPRHHGNNLYLHFIQPLPIGIWIDSASGSPFSIVEASDAYNIPLTNSFALLYFFAYQLGGTLVQYSIVIDYLPLQKGMCILCRK